MNRRESTTNTDDKTQMIHKRSTALEGLVKIFYCGGGGGGLNRFHKTILTLSSDLDIET